MGSSMSVTLPFSTTVACAKTLQSVSIGVSFGPGLTNTVWGSSILVITAVWKRQWNKLSVRQMAHSKHRKASFLLRYIHIYSSNPFFSHFFLAQACLGNIYTPSHFSRLSLFMTLMKCFPTLSKCEGSQDRNSVCSPTSFHCKTSTSIALESAHCNCSHPAIGSLHLCRAHWELCNKGVSCK